MKIYIVSSRGLLSSVSQDPLYELETLIAHLCDATIVAPRTRQLYRTCEATPGASGHAARVLLRHAVGKFEPERLPKKVGPELGLSIAMEAWDLQVFEALGDYRRRFDILAGYTFDAWGSYPSFVQKFDRLFIPVPEQVEVWQDLVGIRPTVMPFGSDALGGGSDDENRPIDLLSYGRLPPEYLAMFLKHFTGRSSRRMLMRIEGRKPVPHPALPYEQRGDHHYYDSLGDLLRRSKISFCFDTLTPGDRTFPHSVVTLRWYEAFAAGCAAVGKRPATSEATNLLSWHDAAIDLPASPADAVDFLHDLLDDRERLKRARLRNYYFALASHDWRWRLRDMFRSFQLPLPEGLRRELEMVEERAASAKLRALNAGALEGLASVSARAG